ncbi:TetR/AcrR family transcriptional regulator [Mycolicibacterium sp. 22603]|uniref:TetR/AcrR family transcriptional regulator n=1 Tax=Mycolicibacterium sp. 22603 TaxID=3453950 RepID=UPI003F86670B
MPRKIDHAARKAELVDALWSVIHHQGVSAVSLRSVAAEAGISVGSLRHIFPTRSALLTSASELMIDNVTRRVRSVPTDLPALSYATTVLLHLIPTDAVSHAEMEINLALISEAGADPELVRLRDHTRAELFGLCRRLLTVLRPDAPATALTAAARRLHVLIDGLAFQLVQMKSARSRSWARALIEDELSTWLAS